MNLPTYDLYEIEEFDPLHDVFREQGFNDAFWDFSVPTIGDHARLAQPPALPEVY
jgi:hypothetical protein